MNNSGTAEKLYSPEVLGLAVELADLPLTAALPLHGTARSKSCGSTIELGLALDSLGLISDLGMQVSACAIGQASAAIFARHAKGLNSAAIANALAEIEAWLVSERTAGTWPDIRKIEHARAFPARHGAMLLPWRAAQQALSKDGGAR